MRHVTGVKIPNASLTGRNQIAKGNRVTVTWGGEHGKRDFTRAAHTCPNKICSGLIQPIPHAFPMDEEGKPARRQTSPSSRASAGISQIVNGQALSATASRTFVTTSDHGFITSRPHLLCSCLKLASRALLRSRLTTPYPCGAKAALLAKLPYAVGSFHPSGQPCGLVKRPCSRRPFSRSFAAHYLQIVNRKWSGFFLGRMCYVTLNVPPLYHIPQHLAKTKNAPVSRLQLPSDVIILVFFYHRRDSNPYSSKGMERFRVNVLKRVVMML